MIIQLTFNRKKHSIPGITKAFDIYVGYSIITIIGLLLDLKTYGPFAVVCCSFFFKIASVICMVIDVMYELGIKFCSECG